MHRISAMFVAICMAVVAGSLGAVLFLAFSVSLANAALIALTVLTALGIYTTVTNRVRDRHDLGDQIADLSRGTADLARQVAEIARRVAAMEGKVDTGVNKARGAVDPLAAEIGELGGLIKSIAETVAAHDAQLQGRAAVADFYERSAKTVTTADAPTVTHSEQLGEPDPKFFSTGGGRFGGMTRDSIIVMISSAVEANRIDLYLQPIVTLPQRKVRYYEALSRIRSDDGDLLTADDFLEYAESGGLMPKIDNMLLFRSVQIMRRLLLKNRDVGLFCNVSMTTLNDPIYFRQFLDFMIANKALAPSMVFEFHQKAFRDLGPVENEALSALAEQGFRFSLDHLTDLRMEPRELADRGFKFIKVPAKLLLHKSTKDQSDIDPADFSDLLARSGIDLIAERIEDESTVIELLDYDVRFGQGFLFSPPRPVRPEALQSAATTASSAAGEESETASERTPEPTPAA